MFPFFVWKLSVQNSGLGKAKNSINSVNDLFFSSEYQSYIFGFWLIYLRGQIIFSRKSLPKLKFFISLTAILICFWFYWKTVEFFVNLLSATLIFDWITEIFLWFDFSPLFHFSSFLPENSNQRVFLLFKSFCNPKKVSFEFRIGEDRLCIYK